MSNEPERNALHEFICASVADCIASIYPRADPERFVKIVNRTKAPACLRPSDANLASCDCPVCVCRESFRAEAAARAPETATQYLARVSDAAVTYAIEAERLRTFLKDCGCPCCSARARLRTLLEDSYNRACESPAAIHCASTDRRNDNEDALKLAIHALRESDEERVARLAADDGVEAPPPGEAVCSNSSGGGQSSHPDAGPARAD